MVGILDSVQSNELKEKVRTIFEKIGWEVCSCDTEACHCLKKDNDSVKVKLCCEDCEHVSMKRELKQLKIHDIGLPRNRSIL